MTLHQIELIQLADMVLFITGITAAALIALVMLADKGARQSSAISRRDWLEMFPETKLAFPWSKAAFYFTSSRLTGWVGTVKTVINGPSKAMLANNLRTKRMTRVHIETKAALLDFCRRQTAAIGRAVASLGGSAESIAHRLADILSNSNDPDATLAAWRGGAVLAGWSTSIIDRAEQIYNTDGSGSESDSASAAPVGSVVVVTGGTSRHKRRLGHTYLIVDQDGSRPVPLGLRGQSEQRRTPFEPGEYRAATEAEVSACLESLNAGQVKMIVCELSAEEPWRSLLAGVIENNGGFCRR